MRLLLRLLLATLQVAFLTVVCCAQGRPPSPEMVRRAEIAWGRVPAEVRACVEGVWQRQRNNQSISDLASRGIMPFYFPGLIQDCTAPKNPNDAFINELMQADDNAILILAPLENSSVRKSMDGRFSIYWGSSPVCVTGMNRDDWAAVWKSRFGVVVDFLQSASLQEAVYYRKCVIIFPKTLLFKLLFDPNTREETKNLFSSAPFTGMHFDAISISDVEAQKEKRASAALALNDKLSTSSANNKMFALVAVSTRGNFDVIRGLCMIDDSDIYAEYVYFHDNVLNAQADARFPDQIYSLWAMRQSGVKLLAKQQIDDIYNSMSLATQQIPGNCAFAIVRGDLAAKLKAALDRDGKQTREPMAPPFVFTREEAEKSLDAFKASQEALKQQREAQAEEVKKEEQRMLLDPNVRAARQAGLTGALCSNGLSLLKGQTLSLRSAGVPIDEAKKSLSLNDGPRYFQWMSNSIDNIYGNPDIIKVALENGNWMNACIRFVRGF